MSGIVGRMISSGPFSPGFRAWFGVYSLGLLATEGQGVCG